MQLPPYQLNLLFQSPIIDTFSPPLKQALPHHCELVQLDKGAYVHRKGDLFTGIYVLLIGSLKAMGVTSNGNAYSLAQINPGTVFGEVAFIDGGDRTHDAVCLTDSTLARIPPKQVAILTQQFPEFYPAMAKLACMHIRQSFAVVDDFLTLSPAQRLAKRLIELDKHRQSQDAIKLKQDELAAWIGISRQSVNKILNKWSANGWITISYGHIRVTDSHALMDLFSS